MTKKKNKKQKYAKRFNCYPDPIDEMWNQEVEKSASVAFWKRC